ncbi:MULTISPECIES: sensor histidine kinase [Pseudonocardia]|uniref:histidine kinase n=2 Tax=Pseudonocardia TaxID=1847 RepID=A0A1Y2N289_PSEAH|nr:MULTISPECIES: histidine kinase [Pseudonocardia]OSY41562.1 Sensor histidine kinase LiaS [Pseudonocardia autotrophica]TDN71517.1 signal transduction histidine kinase [Pseudonocardia autotrophica]BBG02196.1 two-component sensor histidine kinase [Pseudonocardia autotrophica]GEC24210.1 two-component sensor histidine kinase [Pseudonocardia saturnea]
MTAGTADDSTLSPRPMLRLPALVLLAVVFSAADISVYLAGRPTDGAAGPWIGLILPLLVGLSLPLLRIVPRAVVALTVVVSLAMAWSEAFAPGLLVPADPASPMSIPRATPVIVIWLVLTERPRIAYPLVVLLSALAARIWAPAWDVSSFGLLSTLLPAAAALWLDARARLEASLRDRAERAEREQVLIAGRVRAEERRRLAAEMHDVVTHRISGMVLQASALGATTSDPNVREAVDDLRDAGTRALQELRDLIGVLHEDGCPRPAARDTVGPPGEIADLTRDTTGVGAVTLDVDGTPEQVSPTVARTAYRVVQEALTNARKHAPGADVSVTIRYGPDLVRVGVRTSAARRPPDAALVASGGGRGLHGLEQRLSLIGATLDHGTLDDGGYVVDARLPFFVPTGTA